MTESWADGQSAIPHARQHRLRVSCMCDSMPAAVSCCCWGDIPASIASNNPATMTFIMQRFVVPAEEKKSVVSFGPWASVVQHMRSRHQLQTGICRESCQHKASQNLLSIIVEIIHVAAEHSSSHGSNSKPNCIDATTAHHVVSWASRRRLSIHIVIATYAALWFTSYLLVPGSVAYCSSLGAALLLFRVFADEN